MTKQQSKQSATNTRKENPVFTIWVHAGYTILVISMISWIVYIELLI